MLGVVIGAILHVVFFTVVWWVILHLANFVIPLPINSFPLAAFVLMLLFTVIKMHFADFSKD